MVQLHRYRRIRPLNSSEIDCRRAELAAQIDGWLHGYVATYDLLVPDIEAPGSLGALLDRMAATAARALDKLVAAGPSDPATREAWARLSELEDRYAQITGTLTASRAG
ncbi:hypothetical protein V7968_31605 [Nocardia vulneris]|uniref:hypothetical protein n=1 Tax=Nocardia vulneris TaxID=1141657 RepID=UPI0030D33F6D